MSKSKNRLKKERINLIEAEKQYSTIVIPNRLRDILATFEKAIDPSLFGGSRPGNAVDRIAIGYYPVASDPSSSGLEATMNVAAELISIIGGVPVGDGVSYSGHLPLDLVYPSTTADLNNPNIIVSNLIANGIHVLTTPSHNPHLNSIASLCEQNNISLIILKADDGEALTTPPGSNWVFDAAFAPPQTFTNIGISIVLMIANIVWQQNLPSSNAELRVFIRHGLLTFLSSGFDAITGHINIGQS